MVLRTDLTAGVPMSRLLRTHSANSEPKLNSFRLSPVNTAASVFLDLMSGSAGLPRAVVPWLQDGYAGEREDLRRGTRYHVPYHNLRYLIERKLYQAADSTEVCAQDGAHRRGWAMWRML